MRARAILFVLALAVWPLAPALAQGVSEAKGLVVDGDGNPVVGAEIVFTNFMPPNRVYTQKTDKKGRFWMPNLLHQPFDKSGLGKWRVTINADGYTTAKVKIESRHADRTLVADPFETKIRIGGLPVEVLISGLGQATVDFTLSKEALQEAPSKTAAVVEDPFDVARAKFQSGDYEGAVEPFQKAIEAKPEEAERRYLFAAALVRLDRLPEAEAQAARAAQLAPDKAGANLVLAEIYRKKGDNAKAWDAIEKEAKLAPENVGVLERVASLGSEMGKTDEAIVAAETLTRLKPDDPEGWITLGSLYAQKNELEKSERAFRKVVDLDPSNAAQTFYNIGAVLANKPDPSDADNRKIVEALRKAVELKPDYAAAHRELAYAFLRTGDSEGARKELERYLQLEPKASDAAEIQSVVKSLTKRK
ncbi:MAG: tetratricopeptide repeat protein [Acidobacteriia bacterium]|nr:tetratricopeptide repeat protein [Terriglobia bacterium]